MKHLLTAIACCLAVAGSAQTPYNPDEDGDNFITNEDLLSLLSLYGESFAPSFINSEEICIVPNNELESDCYDTSNLPEVIFVTYSEIVDSWGDFPTNHFFQFEFEEGTEPSLPNGMQFWVLTSGDSHTSVFSIELITDSEIVDFQSFMFSESTVPEALNAGTESFIPPRLERYMWWEGMIVQMN